MLFSGVIDSVTCLHFRKSKELKLVYCEEEIPLTSDALTSLEELETFATFRSNVNFENFATDNNDDKPGLLPHFKTFHIFDSTISHLNRNVLHPFRTLKVLLIVNTDIKNFSLDVFEDLDNLEKLLIKTSTIKPFDPKKIVKLNTLRYLGLHDIYTQSKIDYNSFKNLPHLETIFFDLLAYRELDFNGFVNLKTIEYCIDGTSQEMLNFFQKDQSDVFNQLLDKLHQLPNIKVERKIYEEKRHFPK